MVTMLIAQSCAARPGNAAIRKNRVVRASGQREFERVQQARGTVMATNALPRYTGPETDRELPYNARIARAIGYVAEHYQDQPSLEQMAEAAHLSPFHFQRVFKRWAGVSPKRFLQFLTKEGAKELLDRSENLLETTHQVGLSSLGRLHDLFVTVEAVTPGEYKSRGAGVTIRYGLHATPFGKCLIATTDRGICHLSFVQSSEGDAIDGLVAEWKQARMIEDYRATAPLVRPIFDLQYNDDRKPLNVHLRGTNFQLKVWEALLQIPAGEVTTYASLAARIGKPAAARAVGTAIGHNPIAVLIPCHRVIRKIGEFGNYRYGALRKKALLAREFAYSAVDQ
jgi:AraC family transcriptional regulator of adaptative response/methylated-DNA-[protein]-cysteine methyltransferase